METEEASAAKEPAPVAVPTVKLEDLVSSYLNLSFLSKTALVFEKHTYSCNAILCFKKQVFLVYYF